MKNRIKGKLKWFILSGVLLSGVLAVGVTYALLHAQTSEVTNKFQSAKVNIGVIENGKTTPLEDADTNQIKVSGTSYPKTVAIQNIDSEEYPTTDTFVRVRMVAILRDGQGNNCGSAEVAYNTSTGVDDKWVAQSQDNEIYYYYTEALQAGEKTPDLLKSVTVQSDIPQGDHVEIQGLAEGVQARPTAQTIGDKTKTPAYELWGVYPSELKK